MLLAAVVADEVADFVTAEVFLAGEVFAGLFRAAVFWTGSAVFVALFFAALFLAAAVRWGADFLGADVAMAGYPLP